MNEIDAIKKEVSAANYITVSCMFLNELKNNITSNDLKDYTCGHWGTSPAINFLYFNLIHYFKRKNLKGQIVIGTGHSGAALISSQWLDGTLENYYKQYSRNIEGLNNLIKDFGGSIRTEINPQYPETIYDGGELGYSLPVSYGYSLDNDNIDIIPCIIGDGECETGTIASSFHLRKLIDNKKVLPIINLNGFKMGGKSLLSLMNDKQLVDYFKSFGYNVHFVNNDFYNMYNTLDNLDLSVDNLIIFKAPKGFTGLVNNDICISGNVDSHKNPMSQIFDKDLKARLVEEWLNTYDFDIFDQNGKIKDYIISSFNKEKNFAFELKSDLFNVDFNNTSSVKQLGLYFNKIIKNNEIRIFSPDEIVSNKLGCLLDNNNILEILNESIVTALMQGYINSGKFGIVISYESFIPIANTIVSQYLKYLYQKNQYKLDSKKNSMNFILTSTCFENTFSHQNPEFVSNVLIKDYNNINAYYPKDANNLLVCVDKCLKEKDKVNIITVSKVDTKVYQNINSVNIDIEEFITCRNPDIILCATGDLVLSLILNVYNNLKNINPSLNIKVVYVTNINKLDKNHVDGLSDEEFELFFNKNVPCVYSFHGYKKIIKSLLYDRNVDFSIYGYEDKSNVSGNVDDRFNENNMGVDKLSNDCLSLVCNKKRVRKYE